MMDDLLDLVIISGHRIPAQGLKRLWQEAGVGPCRCASAAEMRAWEASAAAAQAAGRKGCAVRARGGEGASEGANRAGTARPSSVVRSGGRGGEARAARAQREEERAHPLPGLERSVLVPAPQDWHDMERLLRWAKAAFATRPWLVMGDLRVVGAFSSEFEGRWATLVGSGEPPEALRAALERLLARRAPTPDEVLVAAFKRGVKEREGKELSRWPGARALQYGCATWLGMRNREIAARFYTTYGNVKSQLTRLRDCLGLKEEEQTRGGPTRDEKLVKYLDRVLGPAEGEA